MISDVNQQNWNFLSDFSSILFGSMEIKTNFRLRQKKTEKYSRTPVFAKQLRCETFHSSVIFEWAFRVRDIKDGRNNPIK